MADEGNAFAGWENAPPEEHRDPLGGFDAPLPELPAIRIRAGEIPRQVTEAIKVLATADRNVYQRDGQLVSIVRQPDRAEACAPCEGRESLAAACCSCGSPEGKSCLRDRRVGRDILTRPGTPRVRTMGFASLYMRLATHARWEKFDARKGKRSEGEEAPPGKWVVADPCQRTVNLVMGLDADWPGVPVLRGVLETPTLAPGGRVIEAPGYDEETGYLLLPSCPFRSIKERPTREQCRAALRYLWTEIACDFPFRGLGEASAADPQRSLQYTKAIDIPDAFVGVAMLLTVFARLAILGAVPGGLFEAAAQGSGKSLQMHTIAMVATGRPAGVVTFPVRDGRPDDAELEKVVMGYALNAARIIAFDNVKGTLTGSVLEKVLTAVDTIDGRILGANDQRSLPWSAVPMFSGNNLNSSDDVAQRILLSRLVSRREDPRSREAASFKHANLLAAIKERRPTLVRAALTILRGMFCAREDGADVPDCGAWGSFEAWAMVIPPAIAWAGGPNILRARPEGGRGGDEETQAHGVLMTGWRSEWQGARASEIVEACFKWEREILKGDMAPDGLDDVRAALRELTHTNDRSVPTGHAVGMKLTKLRDKIRDGRRLVHTVDKTTHVGRYSVEST